MPEPGEAHRLLQSAGCPDDVEMIEKANEKEEHGMKYDPYDQSWRSLPRIRKVPDSTNRKIDDEFLDKCIGMEAMADGWL